MTTGLLVLLALGAPRTVAAEPLPLRQAIDMALARSHDLAASRARLEAAEAARRRVLTAWLPDVKAIATYTHNSDEAVFDVGGFIRALGLDLPVAPPPPTVIQKSDTFGATFAVEQTVFSESPLYYRDAANLGAQAEQHGKEAIRRELAFRVTELYYQLDGAEHVLAAARRALSLAEERIQLASTRQRVAGAESELTLLRGELEKARATQDLTRAGLIKAQLLVALAAIIDAPAPDAVAPPPEQTAVAQDVEALAREAVTRRPELDAMRRAIAATEALVREAELRWVQAGCATRTPRASPAKAGRGPSRPTSCFRCLTAACATSTWRSVAPAPRG